MTELPSLPAQKILSCAVDADQVIDLHLWHQEEESDLSPLLILPDLWENLSYYERDLSWWLAKGYKVYGINMNYDGCSTDQPYPGNFQRVCIYLLQVLAHIRSIEHMKSALVYTKGIGALAIATIARKNIRFIHGMIAYAPMNQVLKPISSSRGFIMQSFKTLLPHMLLPRWLVPPISELAYTDDGLECETLPRRIRAGALHDYLRAIRKAGKIYSRNKLPCLFLLPEKPHTFDFDSLYKSQDKHAAFMKFDLVASPLFHKIRSQEGPCETLNTMIAETFDHWLKKLKDYETLPTQQSSDLPPTTQDNVEGSLSLISHTSDDSENGET